MGQFADGWVRPNLTFDRLGSPGTSMKKQKQPAHPYKSFPKESPVSPTPGPDPYPFSQCIGIIDAASDIWVRINTAFRSAALVLGQFLIIKWEVSFND